MNCAVGKALTQQYFLVQRYDRIVNTIDNIIRIHQEDFCQALGVDPNSKYQSDNGPSLKNCVNLIRDCFSGVLDDLNCLLDYVLYNFIIGNCDAHGKNFSLLMYNKNEIRLAPLYDVLSTRIYNHLSNKMAMKIGDEYIIDNVNYNDFIKFAQQVGLNKVLVLERLYELCDLIIAKIDFVKLEQRLTQTLR